ncbi:MAG TPA: protein-L-isoaspartate(D-aspartate) O-methyltransferase [Candidatus Sulfotelmatobacter sp.]|jgi:protein-L-isoaspartate(D-aspartate) O-methyltransferase
MTDFQSARESMVNSQLRARGIIDSRVLEAMLRVPRHEFVADDHRDAAYEDHPLPIGEGQTISQPYVVAVMLELLQLIGNEKALEVGTGSGYVTALLSHLAAQVFSVERYADLAATAAGTLTKLGYTNVLVLTGDGSLGFAAEAPFDAILVSAAAQTIPPALVEQLKDGGRMVIPVGPFEAQQLQFIRKIGGEPRITRLELVRFVPLISSPEQG